MVAVDHAGRSAPIRCGVLPAGQAAAVAQSLLTSSGFAARALLQPQARSCVDTLGDCTAVLSTGATARDLDLLRAAPSEDVTFVGWSYGARLGVHYASRFPDRVRALVLDGPPDPQAAFDDMIGRSPCVAEPMPLYLVEGRVPEGDAC
ncbi:alpha/beta fold hydrolase [Actinomadura macra]|uniref:alpha/beta fold hydrolase n=1 Tax=Actinomadura macra TaxID=46164 RepID=UPI0008326E1E|nr:alpha/beta fold hydrolase [Actinomadura macra]